MTREEVIQVLRHIIQVAVTSECGIKEIDGTDVEALEMAINELSWVPCDDCISRVDAMRAITDEWVRGKHTLEGFIDAIYNLPPVIPKQEDANDQR